MSCFGVNYNPTPPNVWSRSSTPSMDVSYNELLMKRKVSSLTHYQNSGYLTKNQRYSKIATGSWTTKRTGWALDAPNICPLKTLCLPVSYSNVPGKGFLCSPITKPFMISRSRTTAAGGSNFPKGYKFV
jgi:hypothetical protein